MGGRKEEHAWGGKHFALPDVTFSLTYCVLRRRKLSLCNFICVCEYFLLKKAFSLVILSHSGRNNPVRALQCFCLPDFLSHVLCDIVAGGAFAGSVTHMAAE